MLGGGFIHLPLMGGGYRPVLAESLWWAVSTSKVEGALDQPNMNKVNGDNSLVFISPT